MSKLKKPPLPVAGGRRVEQVYLVQPPVGGGPGDVNPPLGLLLLASVLEAEGCQAHLLDLNLRAKQGRLDARRSLRNQFVQSLPKRSSDIDLIGVTAWSYNFDVTMEFVEAARRKHPGVPIVLGGPHTTFVDEEVLQRFDAVDFVMRDECDHTFPRLIHALRAGGGPGELATIPGLTWRQGGQVVRNPAGGVVEDLDALPDPAYHLIDVREYLAQQPVLLLEAGRGCPYNCNFCSTTNMFQRKYRVKSAARLVDEVERAMRLTGTNRFELAHDNLVANKKYVRELCAEIRRRNIDVDWSCTSRPDNLTEDLAQEMFLAGCSAIFFGVETLSATRQQWTGKRLVPARVHAAIELTRRQHVKPNLGIIVGFPDESEEEFDATVGAAVRWTVDLGANVSTAMLRYYPGADLFANSSELRPDPVAARDAVALAGYEIRPEWRELVRLFPLQAIHTPPEETRTNVLRRDTLRTLLKLAPQTLRAGIDALGRSPRQLLDEVIARMPQSFLERREDLRLWNEVLAGFAAWVLANGSEPLLELLRCEVPFCEREPVVAPMARLEHVILPKRYRQDSLLAWARGEAPTPALLDGGEQILAVRAGPEAVVWFTPKAAEMLAVFEASFAEDRQGTIDYVNSLRRGVL
ncbi:MAG: radical SAM protein [Planctomycetota bacterium]